MDKAIGFFKSKTFLYILLALFCIFLACMSKDYDYDLYARLIVGENFIEKGVFNYKDFYSYTPSHIWYDHEWGASLIFYLFFKYMGVFGLVLVQGITMFFTAFFIIKTQSIQKHAYPVSLAFMGFFLWLYSVQNPNVVRCHMFSFMFFSMFLYILEKTKKTNSNAIWFIPLITLFWNNIHGGVVSGLGIFFIYLAAQIVTGKPFRKFLYAFIVSIAVLFINPYGWNYISFLIFANTMTRKFITEWWTVFNSRHVCYYYTQFCMSVFAVLLFVFNLFKKRKFDLAKTVILFVTVYLGTIHVKLLSLPMITIAALFYNEIAELFSHKKLKFVNYAAYFGIILCVLFIPLTHPLTSKTSISKFPVKEVEFLKINGIKGNILSEFGLSSYIAYKLYPDNLIYLDGRYEEVYNNTEFNKLMHYELVDDTWQDVFNDYPTEILMPEKTIPVYKVLEKDKNWVKIYEGDLCGIFVKRNAVKSKYKLPTDDLKYYQDNEFNTLGHFGRGVKR